MGWKNFAGTGINREVIHTLSVEYPKNIQDSKPCEEESDACYAETI